MNNLDRFHLRHVPEPDYLGVSKTTDTLMLDVRISHGSLDHLIVRSLKDDAFENQAQRVEYIASLRNRFLPLKFAYVGRAAYDHDALVKSNEYGLADAESRLLRARMDELNPVMNPTALNVVDVGSGNGMKALVVLKELAKHVANLAYFGVDYSDVLQKIAKANIERRFPELETTMIHADFETGSLNRVLEVVHSKNSNPALYLFLGHTLGNPLRRVSPLRVIRNIMSKKDKLLVGVELYQRNSIPRVLAHYQNRPFRRAVFSPLKFAGLHESDGILKIVFNRVSRNVEVHFYPSQTTRIRLDSSRSINLAKGDDFVIFLSHRFEMAELERLLGRAGLAVESTVVDEKNAFLVLAARIK